MDRNLGPERDQTFPINCSGQRISLWSANWSKTPLAQSGHRNGCRNGPGISIAERQLARGKDWKNFAAAKALPRSRNSYGSIELGPFSVIERPQAQAPAIARREWI